MKNDLSQSSNLKSKKSKVKFDYDLYINAIKLISDDIMSKYDLSNEKIGLLGMARGGLPMLASVSHFVNSRNISIVQTQMTNSDLSYDYGSVRNVNIGINNSFDKFIILEDIIYKGNSVNSAINLIKRMSKQVIAVYSLVIDEGFDDIQIENYDIPINYCYKINKEDWVYFFWETDIREVL